MAQSWRFVSAVFSATLVLATMHAVSAGDARAESLVWTKTYDGAAKGLEYGNGVATATDGSIYVTGETEVAGHSQDFLLRKYSSSGVPLWTRTYNGAANGMESAWGVAVAKDGSVYVTGYTVVAGQSYNLLLRKYTATGGLLWMRTFNGPANGTDVGYGVAVAKDGSVYVTGYTEVIGQGYNLLLRKYTAAGAVLWMKTFNSAGGAADTGTGVAIAPDGSIFVTGSFQTAAQEENLLLRKYTAAGALVWSRTFNGTGNGDDTGYDVAVAADGSAYVAGYTEAAGQGRNLLLRKYTAGGGVLWTKTFNGSANGMDAAMGVAVSENGSVFVTGITTVAAGTGTTSNLLLRKYTATGGLLWMKSYGPDSDGWAVSLAGDGSIYVVGDTNMAWPVSDILVQKYK